MRFLSDECPVMSLIIGIILAFAVFDMPWTAVVLGLFLLFDMFEIWIWLRWRKKRALTGPESIIGERGKAVTDIDHDEGRVHLRGQNWKARSGEVIPAGSTVEVMATNDLQLEVRLVETPAPTIPS
jgi:membrane protein implicated in regulation of membrane protease activity